MLGNFFPNFECDQLKERMTMFLQDSLHFSEKKVRLWFIDCACCATVKGWISQKVYLFEWICQNGCKHTLFLLPFSEAMYNIWGFQKLWNCFRQRIKFTFCTIKNDWGHAFSHFLSHFKMLRLIPLTLLWHFLLNVLLYINIEK